MNGRTLPSFTSTGVGGGTGLITPAAIGSNTPGPGVCWTYGTTSSNPSPMRSASIPAAAAAPTALPLSLALPAGTAAMNASYALWTDAACAGTRTTRTSRAACATAASIEAPAGAETPVANGTKSPSIATTASYMAPCTIAARTVLLAGGRSVVGVAPAEIAASAIPLQWTTALSPVADDEVVDPSERATASTSAAARPIRRFISALPPGLTGSSRGARRPLVSRRGCPRAPRAESWKPQLFERARPSSPRERIPSLR